MKFLNGKEISEYLKDIVYLDTQRSARGLDLTAKNIYKAENRGEIDFGGGERNDAELTKIEPNPRDPEDDYGWWELEEGTYLLEFNESSENVETAFLQPLHRLTRNSATHPSGFVEELKLVPLRVGEKGISIKESSRTSKLMIFE